MNDPIYIAMNRDDVVSYMSSTWPPRPNDPCLRLPAEAGLTDGGVIVYPQEGQPGYCWWVVDSTVYVQDAGTPGEELAALIPGSVLETVPDPNTDPHPPMS